MASYTNALFISATLVSIFLNHAVLCMSVYKRLTDISPHSGAHPRKKKLTKKKRK